VVAALLYVSFHCSYWPGQSMRSSARKALRSIDSIPRNGEAIGCRPNRSTCAETCGPRWAQPPTGHTSRSCSMRRTAKKGWRSRESDFRPPSRQPGALGSRALRCEPTACSISGGRSTGTVANSSFSTDESATIGDTRLGADVRLLGQYRSPMSLALGAQVLLPTGSQAVTIPRPTAARHERS
jgi:hypothetical protein